MIRTQSSKQKARNVPKRNQDLAFRHQTAQSNGHSACSTVCGSGVTSGVLARLPGELHWRRFSGSYSDVLPHIMQAYTSFLSEDLALGIPNDVKDDVISTIDSLCHPKRNARGFTRTKGIENKALFLQRIITRLDLLAKRVAFRGL